METLTTLVVMAAVADTIANGGNVQVTHIALGDGTWTPNENATNNEHNGVYLLL